MVQPRSLHGATIEKAGPLCRVEDDLWVTEPPASSVIHTHITLKPMTFRSPPLTISTVLSELICSADAEWNWLRLATDCPACLELERFGSLLRKVAFPLLLNVRDIVMGGG